MMSNLWDTYRGCLRQDGGQSDGSDFDLRCRLLRTIRIAVNMRQSQWNVKRVVDLPAFFHRGRDRMIER